MFNNRFNSTKKDPLIEAVEGAMKDGDLRRQAEAVVNEAFGVYSRKAVVREHLSAYDAALEEAYKCMKEGEKWEGSKEDKDEDKKLAKKHGMTMKQWEKSAADKKHDAKEKMDEAKKLADKDYDKDGKVESPKDEVWGSRLRAAKMAGKMEEKLEKEKKETPVGQRPHGPGWVLKKSGQQTNKPNDTWERKYKKVGVAKEETDYSAQNRAPVTKSAPKEDPSTPKVPYSQLPKTQNRAGAVIDSAKGALKEAIAKKIKNAVTAPPEFKETRHPNPGAVTKAPVPGVSIVEDDQVDEAAYSAKAGRAGKDLGKPGKNFAKIAAKAGKKYGSKERGQAVAGAILKRIRAKHMEEQTQIDEIVTKDQLAKSGLSLRDYMNKEKGLTRRDSSTPAAKTSTPQGAVGLKGPTGDAFSKTATQPGSQRWADPGTRDYSKSNQGTIKTPAPSAPTPAPEKISWHAPMVRPPQELASKTSDVNTGAPKVAQGAPMPTTTAAAPKNKETGALPKTMAESVQVGTAKYRIV